MLVSTTLELDVIIQVVLIGAARGRYVRECCIFQIVITAALIAAKTIMKIKFLARMSASRELILIFT